MGTRLYLINGILNNTLTEREQKIAQAIPVVMKAVNDSRKQKQENIKFKTDNKRGKK